MALESTTTGQPGQREMATNKQDGQVQEALRPGSLAVNLTSTVKQTKHRVFSKTSMAPPMIPFWFHQHWVYIASFPHNALLVSLSAENVDLMS